MHHKAPQYKDCCYECNYHDLGHGAKITHYRWVLRSYMCVRTLHIYVCLRMECETSYSIVIYPFSLTFMCMPTHTHTYYVYSTCTVHTPVPISVKWSTMGIQCMASKHLIQVLDLFHGAHHASSARSKHFLNLCTCETTQYRAQGLHNTDCYTNVRRLWLFTAACVCTYVCRYIGGYATVCVGMYHYILQQMCTHSAWSST